MDIEPAHIEQLRQTEDGDWVLISADVGSVVADLKRIDAGFGVRLSKRQGFYALFHANHPDCPHNAEGDPNDPRNRYLVLTAKELDQRVVKEVEKANPLRGYNLADEIDRKHADAEKRRQHEFHEKVGPFGELAAWALRKDLGEKYKGRIFKPREI